MSIVAMTVAHIDALMPFENALFGTEAWSADSYHAELADVGTRHYLAAEGPAGELLGWAGVMVAVDAAEILTVGVVPDARRQGVAKSLIDELLVEAVRRGAVEVFLEVRLDNDAARQLYEQKGFAVVARRRGYYDHGRVDAMVMRRELEPESAAGRDV